MSNIKSESLMSTGGVWFPRAASKEALHADHLYSFILWGSVLLFVGIMVAVGWFIYKFKRTPQNQVASGQIVHNDRLEITWTILPLILCVIIFAWGYKGYLKMTVPPENATEIRVTGKQWLWQFTYPDGTTSVGELVVPVNVPIKFIMTSEDVIHSFFIPNFRIKKDVIPNRYTRTWFEATSTGNFQIFCTEFCGNAHSDMLAIARVVTKEDYKKWLKDVNNVDDIPLDKLGERVYTAKGCNACHSLDGSPKTGPSWKGIYGKSHKMTNGQSVQVDDNYIRESILEPQAKIVAGYQPIMPAFKGVLKDREIEAIIEYIKKVK
jgi:cytochrome c oxidase subunit 2